MNKMRVFFLFEGNAKQNCKDTPTHKMFLAARFYIFVLRNGRFQQNVKVLFDIHKVINFISK